MRLDTQGKEFEYFKPALYYLTGFFYWSKVRVRALDCDSIINHQITDLLVILKMSLKVWSYCYCRSLLLYLVVLRSKDHLSPVYLLQSFSLSLSLKPLCSLNSLSTSLRQNDELYLLDRNCRQICRLKTSKL